VATIESAVIDEAAAWDRFGGRTMPTEAGALVTFAGVVRDHDGGRSVVELEYVAHPSAEQVLHATATMIAERHPRVTTVRVAHRAGRLRVGDTALLAEVSAAHRAEAFDACRDLVEAVKADLPVWKRQVFADGTDEWVNSP
jgi:molybdopterin synthase catalytic subunit